MKDYKTWDEWKEDGVSVVAGEKSYKRNPEGKAVFHINQTDHKSIERRMIASEVDDRQGEQDLIDDGIQTLTAFDIGADF